jgi:hypothetical protein
MHFGTIAMKGTIEDLLAGLALAGSFTTGRAIASFDEAPERDAAGERTLIAGEYLAAAYILDDGLLLSTDPDLIVDASRRLDRPVVAVGAETTSGTYFLIGADAGHLDRFHWNSLGGQTAPYDFGEPLPGEPADGLDDLDGVRLMAVLAAAGFDFEGWADRGRRLLVEASYGDPATGSAGQALTAFLEKHALPGGNLVKPVPIKRGKGAFDLAAPGSRLPDGTRVPGAGSKQSLVGRLFGRS